MHKTYIVKIEAEGVFHHQVIADEDDLKILEAVIAKLRRSATDAASAQAAQGIEGDILHEGKAEAGSGDTALGL